MKRMRTSVIIMMSAACIASIVFAGGPGRARAGTMTAQMGGMMDGGGTGGMTQAVPPGVTPESLPDPGSRGARLVARYCGQCHNLPSPAMHSAGEWPQVADRMFYRMSMMSGGGMMMRVESPTPGEQRTIVAYLQKHALKTATPGAIPSPGTREAALFRKVCSQCHVLPDPKAHTAGEWPAIVERMQSHMSLEGKAMSEDEKKEILDYLAINAQR